MFNPIMASDNIKNEFIDYITTSYAIADQALQTKLKNELCESIAKGPILEIREVFESGKTINQLIDEGIASKLFRDIEKNKPLTKQYKKTIPLDRPLYVHQEKAFKKVMERKNIIVSTGTGSGKTECFLLPIINDLLFEIENGTLNTGVRALLIYPMNALANDQIKRLREIFMKYPQITFGVYNGATEEDENKAINTYEAMFSQEKLPELQKRLPNELLSRMEMKQTPPNILFTNYAMLEHMLLRPNDDALFSNADFKYVVLDEAHIYQGATGIETAHLIRRLKARISSSRETQFILTSATLGDGEKSAKDIVAFGENLCGVKFYENDIIWATRKQYVEMENQTFLSLEMLDDLAKNEENNIDIANRYGYNFSKDKDEKEMLYEIIESSSLYNSIMQNLQPTIPFNTFASNLGLSQKDAMNLISLSTKAVKNGKSLLEARYHYFLKSLEGCYLALSPTKQLFLSRKQYYYENNKKYRCFEIAVCDDCGKIAIVGKINDKQLEQANKIEDEVDYFSFLDDSTNLVDEDEDVDATVGDVYFLCPICGAIINDKGIHNPPCECGVENYIKVYNIKKKTGKNDGCHICKKGKYKRFFLGNDAATSVLATALYEQLPENIVDDDFIENTKNINPFIKATISNQKKYKKYGRQFLVFSDSRQEAAKFACYLSDSYKEFLRRRGIWQLINNQIKTNNYSTYNISEFVYKLSNYYSTKRCFAESNNDNSNLKVVSEQNAWVGMLNELFNYRRRTSLTSLGKIKFEYLGNTTQLIDSISSDYKIEDTDFVKELLNQLAMEIVKTGAIITDNPSDIGEKDREYIFYCNFQKFINNRAKTSTSSYWSPRHRAKDGYYKTNKMELVKKVLNLEDDLAYKFLNDYWDYLIHNENPYCMVDPNKDGNYVMPAKNFSVRLECEANIKWFQCQKCGRISPYSISGKCSTVGCGGEIKEISPQQIENHNHYAKMYAEERMLPLFIKEHTAQLSKQESAKYQQEFIKKEINALSCSTTFEMGVDVGDLETVFLRNVPPLPSNYAQRAGRAGRSLDSAAYALTYAKLSSHDLAFFKEPEKMIRGKIKPPIFKIENIKIVKRHIYAIALSMFLKFNPEMYNKNDAQKFINEKGYEKFESWLRSKPQPLEEILKNSISNKNNLQREMGIDDFSWVDGLFGDNGTFTLLINEYWDNIAEFEKQINKIKKDKSLEVRSKSPSVEYALDRYKHNELIDFLARGNILPKYGFPVDTVELYQNTTASNIKKLRLTRDLQVAISEYAPSSQIVADGKLYTSRYIKKSKKKALQINWDTAYVAECTNSECKAINYSQVPVGKDGKACAFCGKILYGRSWKESIEPRSGFVTERIACEVPMTKQDKIYRTQDYYLGDNRASVIEKYIYNYNGININVQSTTNDSLLVKSLNDFFVCEKCGYAIADDEYNLVEKDCVKPMAEKQALRINGKPHDSQFGEYKCDNIELKKYSLHHKFSTDVAKISFECDTSDYETMISVAFAILNAMSQELNIERRDLKVCLSKNISEEGVYENQIIIYDSVPGGAGHSRRLVTQNGDLLKNILQVAKNNMENCPMQCDPSCYSCLRSYDNQRIHDLLNRNKAKEFLSKII